MATAVFGICSDVQNVASEIEPFSLRVIDRRLKFGNFSLFLISVKPIKNNIAALLKVYPTNIDIRVKKAEYFIVSMIAQGTHINYNVYMQSLIKTFNNIRLDIEHSGTPFVICTQSHGDAEMFTLIKPLLEYGNRRDEAWLQIPSTYFQYKKVTCESSTEKLCLNLLTILSLVYVYRADAYYHLLIWSTHADLYLFLRMKTRRPMGYA